MRTRDGYDIICGKQYWYVDIVGRLFHSIEVYRTYIDMVDCTSSAIIIFNATSRGAIISPKKTICCMCSNLFKSEINAREYLVSQIQEENNRLSRRMSSNYETWSNIDTSSCHSSIFDNYPSKRYAWFSQRAFNLFGGAIYNDKYGREVLITLVHEHPVYDGYKWEDKKFLGEVTSYVRQANQGLW